MKMSLEVLNTIAAFGTFIVIAATAIAALIQLRHLRSNNELSALISISQLTIPPEISQNGARIAAMELEAKMADPAYREAIIRGKVDPQRFPELYLCLIFEQIGTFLKKGLISEATLMEWSGSAYSRYWELLQGPIALMRRRAPWAFQNFEYLAMRARRWMADHPDGTYPSGEPRLPVVDKWIDAPS
ncbi:MAG TPA: hypothetical protein VEV38_05880 [Candidatus Eremiobacteraceae bacterium]|nr:hypothetical protein [Candidatus Eremiobacteraceae bacterium]